MIAPRLRRTRLAGRALQKQEMFGRRAEAQLLPERDGHRHALAAAKLMSAVDGDTRQRPSVYHRLFTLTDRTWLPSNHLDFAHFDAIEHEPRLLGELDDLDINKPRGAKH